MFINFISATSVEDNYGLHPMFRNVKPKEVKPLEPLIPAYQLTTNMEAMVLGFIAEHSLSFSMSPALIELAKELSRDHNALDFGGSQDPYAIMFGMDFILGMQPVRFEPFRGTRVHAPAGIHKGKCKTGQYASTRYGNGKDIVM